MKWTMFWMTTAAALGSMALGDFATGQEAGQEADGKGKAAATENEIPAADQPQKELIWHTDYYKALAQADAESKLLLVYFHETKENSIGKTFETRTLGDPDVQKKLAGFVLAKLPVDAKVTIDGKETKLLEHEAFWTMYGRQGVCIVDEAHKDAKTYNRVVSAFAFSDRFQYDAAKMRVILDLPPGTLTQRTLIYAVRVHPESPKSTEGGYSGFLAEEAESHSQHQAQIQNQGHHNWDSRFHRISAKLPDGMLAQEVCAESWPGEELVEAAVECVHSWRQSSGHWSAVRGFHRLFGYDMKRGGNRIWYATGIFGLRR